METLGWGTIDDLMSDARSAGHEASPRLVADWVADGLLDGPTRKALGRGRGSDKGRFPENQRLLFLTLLDKRAQGHRQKRTLAQVPIFLWCVFGDGYVPTRQVAKAIRTWVGDATANLERSRQLAREVLALHDHPAASPADRRELTEVIANIAHSGRVRDVDKLRQAVKRVFEPATTYGAMHRAVGHPDVMLTVDTMVTLVEVRQEAVHAVRAGRLSESDLLRARQLYQMSRLGYVAHLAEYRAQASEPQVSLFRQDTPQRLFDNCAPDLLTCIGQIIHKPD